MAVTRIAIGLVPVWDDPMTSVQLEQIRRLLEKHLDSSVVFIRYRKPEMLARAFEDREVDLAWTSPILALTHPCMSGGIPMASAVRQGATYYHSVLFTSVDSGLMSASQLQGTSVAWVAPTSAGGYVFPRVALASQGLDPQTLFKTEIFCFSHGGVVDAVLTGQADVGATFAVFEDGDATKKLLRAGFQDSERDATVRILVVSTPIPSDLWLGSRAAVDQLGGDLLSALQRLCSEAPNAMLSVFGAEMYEAPSRKRLEQLREDVEHAQSLELISTDDDA
ncbi:MAG: phosphate/phosphite/phosphonate ABC transporter substrate-binding protein [Polyangiaceae bacterium]